MAEYNYASKEINVKIVYYGPGLCGKTTNLQYIFNSVDRANRGEMIALATKTDRTLYFDFLPIHAGTIHGFKTRFLLYTVPGQVYYDSTRKVVLRGADGVIFVADSSPDRMEANKESLRNLATNLNEHKLDLKTMPWVLQFNKRDLNNALTLDEMMRELNDLNVPAFSSCAVSGEGVFETLHKLLGMTMISLNEKAIKAGRGALFTGSGKPNQKFEMIDWFADLANPPTLDPGAEVKLGAPAEERPPAAKTADKPPAVDFPIALQGMPELNTDINITGSNNPEEEALDFPVDLGDWQPETSFAPPPPVDIALDAPKAMPSEKTNDGTSVNVDKILRVKKTIDLPLQLRGDEIPGQIQLNLVLNIKLIPDKK